MAILELGNETDGVGMNCRGIRDSNVSGAVSDVATVGGSIFSRCSYTHGTGLSTGGLRICPGAAIEPLPLVGQVRSNRFNVKVGSSGGETFAILRLGDNGKFGADGQFCQLSAVFPGISIGIIVQGVADGIVIGVRIDLRQQVAPGTVAVLVSGGVLCGAQLAGGVGVLVPGLNIARVVVSPGVGKAPGLVILPDQLIRTVIDVAGDLPS